MKIRQIFQKKWLITWILLFSLSFITPPVIAQITTGIEAAKEGANYYQLQDYQKAVEYWQEAADKFSQAGDKTNQVIALSNLSLTYQKISEWDEAKTTIDKSLEILANQPETLENQNLLAQTIDIKGKYYQSKGEYENALEIWQKSADIYTELDNQEKLSKNLINQAESLQYLGFNPRACQKILKSLTITSSKCEFKVENEVVWLKNLPPYRTKALVSLANILKINGELEAGENLLEKMLNFSPDLSPTIVANANLELGNIKQLLAQKIIGEKADYELPKSEIESIQDVLPPSDTADMDDPNNVALTRTQLKPVLKKAPTTRSEKYIFEAINSYQTGLKAAEAYPEIKAQIYNNYLALLIKNNLWFEAEALTPEVEKNIPLLPLNSNSIYAQVNLSKSLVCIQQQNLECFNLPKAIDKPVNYQPSYQLLRKAIDEAEQIGDLRAESYAFGNLAQLFIYQNKIDAAQAYTEKALQFAQQIQADDLSYQWDWQLARIAKNNDKTTAISYYNQAYNILQDLREDLVALNPDIQFSFRNSIEPVYREYVDLLLDEETPSQTNLQKSIEVIEALKLAELNNFFRDSCVETKPVNIQDVDKESAIIYTIILPNRIEEIIAFPGEELQNYKTYVPQTQVEENIEQIQSNLREVPDYNTKPETELINLLEEVYSWLISPIEAQLNQKQPKNLVFISDGKLNQVPAASLYDGNQYLIQKYSIVIAPSLQLIDPQFLARQQVELLLGGVSNFENVNQKAGTDLSNLPGVKIEVENVKQKIPDSKVLFDTELTQINLNNAIKNKSYQIIHLATHGQFSSNVEETYIVAWDQKINIDQLRNILLSQRSEPEKPIELLVLSACETATGDDRATLGLAGVAVRAGARSTIASLWSVSDDATVDLMTSFYEKLATGNLTKAEALRQAQIDVLNQDKYAHPFFWSPFILVGNWL